MAWTEGGETWEGAVSTTGWAALTNIERWWMGGGVVVVVVDHVTFHHLSGKQNLPMRKSGTGNEGSWIAQELQQRCDSYGVGGTLRHRSHFVEKGRVKMHIESGGGRREGWCVVIPFS